MKLVYQQAYRIRGFRPNDLTAVIEINRLCLPENYTPGFFVDIYKNCPEAFLVAEVNGFITGYCMARIEFGFSEFNRIKMVKKGHLVSVAVLEPYRRLGIASSLLRQALSALYSRGVRECFLEVRETNTPGIFLYRKLGFEIARTIPQYYHDGADALLMAKVLA
ncbi:MAG: N-acetyltransferase [Candidatus Bathyarchaeia archaeon]